MADAGAVGGGARPTGPDVGGGPRDAAGGRGPARVRRGFLVALGAAALLALSLAAVSAWPPARALVRRALGAAYREREIVPPDLAAPAVGARPALAGLAWLRGAAPAPGDLEGRALVVAIAAHDDPRAPRVLAAVQAWHDAYARRGVRAFAVLSAALDATRDTAAAAGLARRTGVTFPVAWDATGAAAATRDGAPEVLVVDATGALRFRAGCAELAWADLALRRAVARLAPSVRAGPAPDTLAWGARLDCPEPRRIALGAGAVARGPLAGAAAGRTQVFTTQFRFQEEGAAWTPVPVGRWIPRRDGLEAARAGAADFLAIRYHAGAASIVASPPREGPAKLWILLDDDWLPPAAMGEDARREPGGGAYVEVTEPRLYRVARGAGGVLRLSPGRAGLVLHALTFEDPSGPARP